MKIYRHHIHYQDGHDTLFMDGFQRWSIGVYHFGGRMAGAAPREYLDNPSLES